MKRKRSYVILISMLVFVSIIGCEHKQNQKNEESATEMVFSEISEEYIKEIKQIFELDIPKEGKIIHYESSLERDALGYVFAEIEFSEKYYENMIEKIERGYYLETMDIEYLEKERFKTTENEIDNKYYDVDGFRRDINVDKFPLSLFYHIYTTKPENGTFKLMFVARSC